MKNMNKSIFIWCQEHITRENVLVGAQDLASATQVEHCALHLTHVPYLSDRRLTQVEVRGENLVDICTDCI